MNAPFARYHLRQAAILIGREDESPYGPAPESVADWNTVHERIVALRGARGAHEREVCRWLVAAERLDVAARAGHASLREYAERTIGLSGRETEERLRVGRALAGLPLLDRALADGELAWSAVREITRVATAETEQVWRDWATRRRAREIERAVAARRPGEAPTDRGHPELVRHRLSFEVRAETMAAFRDLQARVRAELGGGEIDDDTLLYEIARRALGGPGDEGRASYQVAAVRCHDCGLTRIDAGGESHAVEPAVAEMITCDSQDVSADAGPHMGAKPANGARPRATQTIPPAVRRQVMRRDRKRCAVPGCHNHTFLDVHHIDARAEGGQHDPDRLISLCGVHHRRVHAGALVIGGCASGGFTFRHADGTPYGAALSPPAIDVAKRVQDALERMGFKPQYARGLIDAVVRAGAPETIEDFLRAALRASAPVMRRSRAGAAEHEDEQE